MKRPQGSDTTLIYGVHPVIETLKKKKRRVECVYLCRDTPKEHQPLIDASGLKIVRLSPADMLSLAQSERHQGIAAKVAPFPYADIEDLFGDPQESATLLVLDEVQDPNNLGAVLRACDCLGGRGVIIAKDRAGAVTAVVEKASSGASAHVPVARVPNLVRAVEQLKEAGFWLHAAEAHAPRLYTETDLSGRTALALGSEGKGLRRLVREHCDVSVRIPMQGAVDSLNVAQTAAVILSECLRQRLAKTKVGAR